MRTPTLAPIDPWRLEIIVVRAGSHSSGERGALRRDVERGLLLRIGHGLYVDRAGFESLDPADQHVVRMRAITAAGGGPVVFSHWSAAVLHGLPVLWGRLTTVHRTVDDPGLRSRADVTGHVFALQPQEVVEFGELLATALGRTVVDVAGAAPFEEGVMAADGALRSGVPREQLLAAVDRAGPRRAGRRILDAVSFAHPGAESAAESRVRVALMRLGMEVPVLQFRIRLTNGSDAFLDVLLPEALVGLEVDGDRKYLDPALAPEGAGRVIVAEKRREDEVRTHLRGFARLGWIQSGSASMVRTVLGRLGVRAPRPRRTLVDYAAAAAEARPRFVPRRQASR